MAEAELEYNDAHISPSIYVTFPLTTISEQLKQHIAGWYISRVYGIFGQALGNDANKMYIDLEGSFDLLH